MRNAAHNSTQQPRLLNIGCGRRFHGSWLNIDLESVDPRVLECDITAGLPFEDNSFDAVYHSHVLEHLDPRDGEALLDECFRVLRPEGVLRIVVPNLERIATLYLKYHQQAWSGQQGAAINYRWMKLELLDQLVRSSSGGRMGQYMASEGIKNVGFVRSRLGDEFLRILDVTQENAAATDDATAASDRRHSLKERAARGWSDTRTRLARWCVKRLLGKSALKSFDEGLFRAQGEVHRWMYDRYSLKQLCQSRGFVNFQVQTANESSIESYASFELDAENGNIRKPDSLFVECRKGVAQSVRKAG